MSDSYALMHDWQVAPHPGWHGPEPLGGTALQIALGSNQDKRIEVFYVGTDSGLYHNWQTTPNGVWAAPTRFAQNSALQIAVASNVDGRLELFYIGTDNVLYHNWQTAPNNGWAGETAFSSDKYGHPFIDTIGLAAATNQDGRIELFILARDFGIYHIWQVERDGRWTTIGRDFPGYPKAQQITAIQNARGLIEMFYVGTENQLCRNSQIEWGTPLGGPWTGEIRFDKNSAKQVSVGMNEDGRLEIFYVGTDNGLYHNRQTKDFLEWEGEKRFDDVTAKQVTVATNADGRLEIFYVGTNGELFHNWQTSKNSTDWNGEDRIDGSANEVAVIANQDGRLEIFYSAK